MTYTRGFVVWLAIMFAETIHGVIRNALIAPRIGDLRARQWGVLIGSLLIFVINVAAVRWIGARTKFELFNVGLMWVLFTVTFELVLGLAVIGFPLSRILEDYDLSRGGLMPFGLLFMLFSPYLASLCRR